MKAVLFCLYMCYTTWQTCSAKTNVFLATLENINSKWANGTGKGRLVSTPNTIWSNTASEILLSARHFAQKTKVTKQRMLIDKWVAKCTSKSKGTWISSSELPCTDLPRRITQIESIVLMPGPIDSKVSYMPLRVLNSTRWTAKWGEKYQNYFSI